MSSDQFVIVGGGLAAAKAAETLRDEGFAGRIVIISDDPERPYERPPLSKGLLLGSAERDSTFVHEADWYTKNDVDLRTGIRAEAIDKDAHEVVLAGGERVGYSRLLLATGARPRRLPVPGADLDGVHYLRTLADSDRLGSLLTESTRLVIIGAGWIGLEIAAAARARGAAVTVVEMAHLPLQRVLGDTIAEVFAGLHREHGVTFHFDAGVAELRGSGGRVGEVVLADGTVLPADAVLVAVGAQPNTELAEAAGLPVDNGVLVDASLASGEPDIFAAGDVANAEHPLLNTRVRVEHWANALNMGPVAAKAMMGRDASYDLLPYFYTDQYDLGMEYSGLAPAESEVVVRGDLAAREFIAFWVDGGRVLAGMNVNIWDVTDDIQALVRAGYAGRAADPQRLADPAVPLGEVLS